MYKFFGSVTQLQMKPEADNFILPLNFVYEAAENVIWILKSEPNIAWNQQNVPNPLLSRSHLQFQRLYNSVTVRQSIISVPLIVTTKQQLILFGY